MMARWKSIGLSISLWGMSLLALGLLGYHLWMRESKTLVVDLSACSAEELEFVSSIYSGILRAHQRGKLRVSRIVLVGDTREGVAREDIVRTILMPNDFRALERSGAPNAERLVQLMEKYPNPELMTCDRVLMQQLDPMNMVP